MSASRRALFALPVLFIAASLAAQRYPAALLSGLQWRDVGPMRGGRTYAVSGNAAQPDTFYMGSVGGGVWKTENSGRTWFPIADDPVTGIPIGSIGAIAVAPSDANIVYVGTGEPDIRSQHSYGIGVFKSTDAGKTWHSIGLDSDAPDRQNRRRPLRSQPRLRCCARPPLQGQPRTRRLSLHRWRRALEEDSLEQADPDDVGAVDLALDPQASAHHLRIALGNAPSAVGGLCAVEHARRRPLQIHRRRRHLASTQRRPAQRWLRRQDRHRSRAQQSQPALRGGRRSRHGDRAILSHGRAPAAPTRPNPPAAFMSPTMPAQRGVWSTASSACGAADGTSARWPSIPPIPIAPTTSTPRPT